MSVHVIPVPRGMTAEDAWAEISMLGQLVEAPRWTRPWRRWRYNRRLTWAVIEVDDDRADWPDDEQPVT